MKRKILSILIIAIMALNIFPDRASAEAAKSKRLVLIERWDGNWYAYETLADTEAKGFMIDLQSFASFIGYDYWYTYSNNTVTVAKSKNRSITYKIDKNRYTYQAGSKNNKTKEAKYKTYCEDGKYYVHAATLGNLCYYKYFEGKDQTGEYGKKGFTSIVCFSDKGKVTRLPDIKKVKNDVGFTWIDTFVQFDNIEEPGKTEIFGLTFNAPESFTNPNLVYWDEDPEMTDIQSKFKDIVSYNSLATMEIEKNYVKCTFNSIYASFYYDLTVTRGMKGFFITIRYSLNEVKRQMLKALCYKISSTPETLYNVIVYDYTKEAFLPDFDYRYYGDFQICAYISGEYATYYVKPAN